MIARDYRRPSRSGNRARRLLYGSRYATNRSPRFEIFEPCAPVHTPEAIRADEAQIEDVMITPHRAAHTDAPPHFVFRMTRTAPLGRVSCRTSRYALGPRRMAGAWRRRFSWATAQLPRWQNQSCTLRGPVRTQRAPVGRHAPPLVPRSSPARGARWTSRAQDRRPVRAFSRDPRTGAPRDHGAAIIATSAMEARSRGDASPPRQRCRT
jgi:hypothetical protein